MKVAWTLFLLTIVGAAWPNFSRAEERWVAVGYGGRRMVSTDGLKWEITAEWAQPGGDDGNNLMSAVFAQNRFVVVGGGGGGATGAGHILVSDDGREWKETYKAKGRINPIVYGNDRFIVGTSSYPSGKLMWSGDAETWKNGAAITARGLTHFRHGAFGNGLFVFVGNGQQKATDGTAKPISWSITSKDGETIVGERTDLPGQGTIVFGAGKFLMLTSPGDADLISSADGLQWESVVVDADVKLGWLVWTGEAFLVGSGQGVYRSTDGVAWAKTEFAPSRGSVKWSDGIRFIASSWPGKMAFSADGKSWTDSPSLSANGINRVVLGEVK
ncbi:MAG: hypothetical protein C0483_21035 [Pirellula sp.]|nr:hypothetical protein [Pirellula sp.]